MRRAPLILIVLLVSLLAPRARPRGEAAQGGVLLVTNKSENTLSFIDPASGAELARIATGPAPHEVAATPDGRLAFVANYGANSLTVVDVAARQALGMIDLGSHTRPHGLTLSADGRSLWVTTEGSQELVEVDVASRRVTRAIATGERITHMVALAEGKGKAYTANIGSGTVTAIDLRRGAVLRQIATGAGAEGIAVTPNEKYVLVTNREAGTLSVISVESDEVVHSMEIGGFPIRVAVTPDGRRALVSQMTAGTVLEIAVGTWGRGRQLSVGAMPVGIEIHPEGRVAYVANTRDDRLTVVDLDSFELLMTIAAGDEPDGMAYVGR
jgi:YVTN family beta-propeller protein